MNRRNFLQSLAAASALPAQTPSRPNFVFLYADDMGWSDTGFNGRKEWSTPNLDRLASQGTVFDRWYTAMPLCAPSRACLLTGRYTIHHTVRGNSTDIPKSEVTIAEALKPLGYKSALMGKWHQGKLPGGGFTHPLDQGFDQTYGYLDAIHAWEHFPKKMWRGRDQEDAKGYSSDLLVDESIKFLNANRNNPFFLYVPFIEPHFHIEAPEEDLKLYRGKFAEKDPSKPVNANYAAMIHRLDKSIGRLMKSLDDMGLANNTVVVFSSDNGATFESRNFGASWHHDSNRPHRGQKRSLEEGGIRVPGLVRWPGRVPAGKRSKEPVHMTDVMPSFLSAAGTRPDPSWKVDGMDMTAVWQGKAKAPERTLFWEFNTENVAMHAAMRGDFKLLEIGGNRFLYDVARDPGERRTLAQEHPEMFAQLRKELDAWLATTVKP